MIGIVLKFITSVYGQPLWFLVPGFTIYAYVKCVTSGKDLFSFLSVLPIQTH